MDRKKMLLALLMLSSIGLPSIESKNTERPEPGQFIESSCRSTRYPSLCIHTLSAFAAKIRRNDYHLAVMALSVSLVQAKSAAQFVGKLTGTPGIRRREYLAVKDCVETLGDGVDRLAQSVRELNRAGRTGGNDQEFMWRLSNVQTWASAALTDVTTCLDGFAPRAMDGNVKELVRKRVVNVAQVTSNALALVNRFAERRSVKERP